MTRAPRRGQLWATAHGGNKEHANFYPIKTPANTGSAILHFPPFHSIGANWNRGFQIGDPQVGKVAFGRLGDWISFDELPPSLRTAGFAEAIGAAAAPAAGAATYEMCGSAGEVANEPLLGNKYYFGAERYSTYRKQQELLLPHSRHADQKHSVHSTLGLFAPDELRQRVAWSLSQVLVIGEFSSAVLGDHNEAWTYFYDILVRHAFGNYRDILREGTLPRYLPLSRHLPIPLLGMLRVRGHSRSDDPAPPHAARWTTASPEPEACAVSFNPVMARYLTFYNSASYAWSSSVSPTACTPTHVLHTTSITPHAAHAGCGACGVRCTRDAPSTHCARTLVQPSRGTDGAR